MIRRLLVLAAVLAAVPPAAAQSPYWDMAPLRVGFRAVAAPGPEALALAVTVERSVPLDFFLPNVSPGSFATFLAGGAGVRVADGGTVLRWKVVPLDLDLTRPPWTGGVTLLRYDRLGLRTLEADWFAVHGGPAARLALGRVTVEPALVLRGMLATRTTGRHWFPDLPDAADEGATGAGGSATLRLSAWTPGRAVLRVAASEERLWAGPNPGLRRLEADLDMPLNEAWSVGFRGGMLEARLKGASDRTAYLGFSIRLTPRSTGAGSV